LNDENKPMQSHSSRVQGIPNSLVFTFREAFHGDEDFSAPEPDFLKWLEKSIFVDVVISGDEAEDKQHSEEEREAWRLYREALEATNNLFDLYKANPSQFQNVAGQMMFLPCFISRHPDNERFNRHFLQVSQLSRRSMDNACQPKPQHLARQSWPTRYAYAIRETIDLTLDTYEERLPEWAEIYGYGKRHPIPMSLYEETARKMGLDEETKRLELPRLVGSYKILPAWTKTLENFRRPFNPGNVLSYWRTGKAMILEELPDFHLRPEWESYRRRHYQTGSKPGTVQHAIFKDILAALRTIAGSNQRRNRSKPVTK
jgi:hypothetical protein